MQKNQMHNLYGPESASYNPKGKQIQNQRLKIIKVTELLVEKYYAWKDIVAIARNGNAANR